MPDSLRKKPKLAASIVLQNTPKIAEREAGKNVEMRHQTLSSSEELSVSINLLAGTEGKIEAGWNKRFLAAAV